MSSNKCRCWGLRTVAVSAYAYADVDLFVFFVVPVYWRQLCQYSNKELAVLKHGNLDSVVNHHAVTTTVIVLMLFCNNLVLTVKQ